MSINLNLVSILTSFQKGGDVEIGYTSTGHTEISIIINTYEWIQATPFL
jgi:hypothetical protein